MSALLSIHYVDKEYSDGQRAEHLAYLKRLRPAYVNILGASQFNEAVAFATEVRQHIPETQVIFRHFKDGGDDGLWTRVTPKWFIEGICNTYYKGRDWYIVTDNEANADDLRPYALWHAEVIQRASDAGIKLAVGRFPTHNPATEQINAGQLDPMWHALAKHPEHIWSPNVYFSIGNHDGLKHINVGLRRMQAVTGKTPTVVLGEYAYAKDLDPHKGHGSELQASGEQLLATGYELLKQHLPGTPACWYCEGDWHTFGMTDAMRERLITLQADSIPTPQPPIVTNPPPTPEPPPPPPIDDGDTTEIPPLYVTRDQLDAILQNALTRQEEKWLQYFDLYRQSFAEKIAQEVRIDMARALLDRNKLETNENERKAS